MIRYHKITLDSGLSGLLWQLDARGNYIRPIRGQTYLNLLPLDQLTPLWNSYFRLKQRQEPFYPLLFAHWRSYWTLLSDLVGVPDTPRILIHCKDKAANATRLPTDPATYAPLLEHFRGKGFQLVFVGREKMPSLFSTFGVINYANSDHTSFLHDVLLFQSCHLAIIAGSGISFLADCYRKPYLYCNFWHLATPVESPYAVCVPTLLRQSDGRLCSFSEQIALFTKTKADGSVEGLGRYPPRNATGEELLQGVFELETLMTAWQEPNAIQRKVKRLAPGYPLEIVRSRYANYFLEQHEALLQQP
jgi:putative glycosyltransferase (TIGR04372 family)